MDEEKLIRDTNIIYRFSDVDEERCIILPPIEMFQDNLLVSLKEAVEPLIPIVHDIIYTQLTIRTFIFLFR